MMKTLDCLSSSFSSSSWMKDFGLDREDKGGKAAESAQSLLHFQCIRKEVSMSTIAIRWALSLSNSEPKLQFRKDNYKARWDAELGMAEVIEKKGVMWKTMGIFRKSKHYFSIEETLFLAERGALLLQDEKDTILSQKDIYKMVAEANDGCCWESFKAFRHLKSLGYIVARHGVPWTSKNDNKSCKPTRPQGIPESDAVSGREMKDTTSVSSLLQSMQINNLKPAFDVYLPNSNFRISSLGDPNFVPCIARDPPSKIEIENLERRCNGVPLKICNVEHGRVSFFSFNKTELPVLP
ncbi:hypothetical protein IFM89_000539 [Coptis chinensis]|uniref:tRNA-splicing endonuclease subunit Sen54 N-terminal domain-containing protein n=1 Tax=Coptis chinensis TaxID=261450 RepID=A0A835LGJ2_9MAGN|nr:hypothetical protein IFM89_000539 [Coptis chinensis]